MIPEELPYIFAISDHEPGAFGARHAIIAQRLTDAGYDVGLMLWTATPCAYSPDEIRAKWQEAFDRAGITRMDVGRDETKMRHWYKVWPRPKAATGV